MSMSTSMSDTPQQGLHTPVSEPAAVQIQNPFRADFPAAAELPQAPPVYISGRLQFATDGHNGSGLMPPVPPPAFGTTVGVESSANPFLRNTAGRQSLNSNATSLHSRASRAEQVCVNC
jgi:hypothetical protein